MALRADDGTLLDAKEAIVLDQEGNVVADPSYAEQVNSPHLNSFRVFKVGNWFLPLAVVAVMAAMIFGTVFVVLLSVIFAFLGAARLIRRLVQ
jgi:hypothetical protein